MRRRDRLYAWIRRHPLVPDGALALGLALILVLPTSVSYSPGLVHGTLGVITCAALVFRRVRPVPSFAVVAACGLIQWALGVRLTPADALLLLSLFSISGYGPRWASRAGLVTGMLGVVLAVTRYMLGGGAESVAAGAVALSALVVGAWALGDVRRVRQAYVDELVSRAQQDERARIAREMHDVVAHNLSVIVVQADGGRYVADEDPQAAVKVLETIGDTGRGALADMRRLLGVLRTDAEQAGELAPQPGVALVHDLVASVRRAGLTADLDVHGEPRALDAGSSLAVYRAIQEALTNAMKHAGPRARTVVSLTYDAAQVAVEVIDDGRGAAAPSDGQGHGLVGMRERITAYGGAVDAGPRSDGGWRVHVTMPYGEGE